jgi:Ser-tRNA(Ala) deacylase AlaX
MSLTVSYHTFLLQENRLKLRLRAKLLRRLAGANRVYYLPQLALRHLNRGWVDSMAVKKRFWDDPYLTHLETYITGVHENEVTLAETIFYAFSGGQESDTGTIADRPVLHATKADKEIRYTLEPNHGLNPGDPVTINIDWERRYKLMRLHFAAEIVLELVYQHVPSIQKIGAHIAQDKSRIDFEWGENISTLFPLIKEKSNALIAADHAIISAFSDEENQRRYWEIEGFAHVACGGTHLRKTGEVGELELKRKNIGKGKDRIEIYVSNHL